MANHLQSIAIRRYHDHLHRLGRTASLEESARTWIARYARLFRERYTQSKLDRAVYWDLG